MKAGCRTGRIAVLKQALGVLLLVQACFAHAFPTIPVLSSPVIDEAAVLTAPERARLEDEVRAYMPQLQLQIWTIPSLDGESIEGLSIRAVEEWKLGTAKGDNGVLILVALNDRRMRIEVGQGLEGNITDLQAGRIVDHTLRPSFRDGRFFDGLQQASRQIYTLAGGGNEQFQAREAPPAKKRKSVVFTFLFLGFIVVMFFIRLISGFGGLFGLGRRSRWGSSWGGGSGWGGGGGGGWSGGGGGFSGGGSSGSW